ncbi:MAG: hypothetical protein IPI48_18510 [bacterium]|nr:hypothetical protein [bacterium]
MARYDSRSCIECHQDAHDQWNESAHSRPIFGTGRTAMTFRTSIDNGCMTWESSGVQTAKDVRVEHLMGCAKCHLPQLADATDKVAQEIVATIDAWREAVKKDDETGHGEVRRHAEFAQHQLPGLPQPQRHHPQVE